jgi:hypothetical protein
LKELVQNFDAKPAEIKALFANQLDPIRAGELRDWIAWPDYRSEIGISQLQIMWSWAG